MEITDKDIKRAYDLVEKLFSKKQADAIYEQALLMFPKKLDEVTKKDENALFRKAFVMGALSSYIIILNQKNDGIVADAVNEGVVDRLCEEQFRKEMITEDSSTAL